MGIVAGIGSRKTPSDVLEMLEWAGWAFATQGWQGRSGGADGADVAFERGYRRAAPHLLRSYRPSDATPDCHRLASMYHPAWDNCGSYAKALHARNGLIVLGDNLHTPVDLILCWTPEGRITGGTGQALRIAEHWRIPVFNLATCSLDDVWKWAHG